MSKPVTAAARRLLATAFAALVVSGAAAEETRLEVIARTGPGAEPVAVANGSSLRTGDEVQVRVTTANDAYVYVVAYGSSGTALLLHPFSGDDEEAFLPAGEHALPEPDIFLPLDEREGTELIVAFASAEPVGDIGRLLQRMESRRGDTRAVMGVVRGEHPDAGAVAFRNVGREAVAPEAPAAPDAPDMEALIGGLPAAPDESGQVTEPGVLGASGSRIQALIEGRQIERSTSTARPLDLPEPAQEPAPEASGKEEPRKESLGKRLGRFFRFGRKREAESSEEEGEPGEAESSPEPRSEVAPVRAYAAGPAAGPEPLPLEPLDAHSRGEARDAADGAPDAPGVGLGAGPSGDPLQSTRASAAESAPLARAFAPAPAALADDAEPKAAGAPAATTQAAAALAPRTARAVHSRPSDGGDAAPSVVLVVTPTGSGAGVVVQRAGHVLTNWHTVRDAGSVAVVLPDAGAGEVRRRRAQVVRINRFSDLALLAVDEPPDDLSPVSLADDARPGAAVRIVGHDAAGEPARAEGRVATIKPNSAWYSGNRVLHRGTLMRAELGADPGTAGAPVLDDDGRMLGLTTRPRRKNGMVPAIAVDTIRAFLGEPT